MSAAIIVENLSKRYVIGHAPRHDTLRDSLTHRFQNLWRGRTNSDQETSEEFWALRDVSFSIPPGEVVGIIGRNGAGKSTLLKILSRITEPTQGRITLKGRVASLLEVGTGFHPELSGYDNIYLNGAILGMSRAEIRRKFDEIVAFAEVERFLDTPVKRYSSGMYVRLAFAVAAHLDPEILIVDEVLAVGDQQFQRKCLGKIREVAGGGRTVLFVSHNLAAVRAMCTRAIWLDSGRLRHDGDTESCLRIYLDSSPKTQSDTVFDATASTVSRQGDGQARIRRVTIRDPEGGARNRLLVGEPFTIEVEIENHDTMPCPLIGFHLSTAEQQIVVSSNHHDSLHLNSLPAGRHLFTCQYDGPSLGPGTYGLSFAISTPSLQLLHDSLSDCLMVEVHAVLHRSIGQDSHLLDGRPGLVRKAMTWTLTDLPPSP